MSWAGEIVCITGSAIVGGGRLGGDLGGALRLDLADGRSVVAKQSGLAKAEGDMLHAIRKTGAPVPQVIHSEGDLLLMEFVEGGDRPGWAGLADALRLLHARQEQAFGWDADYRFDGVAIPNQRCVNWAQFWGENRIACHAEFLGPVTAERLEMLMRRIDDLLPATPPSSLLHGDLWGGNMIFAGDRLAALIDPACYYGHREADIAMLTLFDHPPDEFFEALELESGWRERLPVYRLWPLLVHLRLFGESYRGAVDRALDACGV